MDNLIYAAIAGVAFGIALAFYLTADQLKDSNEIGNSKGDRLDYITTFNLLDVKNDVSMFFDIDKM